MRDRTIFNFEIEITPEMFEAGLDVLATFNPEFDNPRRIIEELLAAIFLAARRGEERRLSTENAV